MLPEPNARPFESFLPELVAYTTARAASPLEFVPVWEPAAPAPASEPAARIEPEFDQAAVDALVTSAYDRGYQVALAAACAKAEKEAERLREEAELAIASARYADLLTYAQEFSERLDQGLRRIECEHSEQIAALLTPLVARCIERELMHETLRAIEKATSLRSAVSVTVGGPAELADRLAVELSRRGIGFTRDESGDRDLTVALDGTEVRMGLSGWLEKLEGEIQ